MVSMLHLRRSMQDEDDARAALELEPTLHTKIDELLTLLAACRPQVDVLSEHVRWQLMAAVEGLRLDLQKMPDASAWLSSCRCLANLSVSLWLQDEGATLERELEQSQASLQAMLSNQLAASTMEDMEVKINAALLSSGAARMPCGHTRWRIEVKGEGDTIGLSGGNSGEPKSKAPRRAAIRRCSHCSVVTVHSLEGMGLATRAPSLARRGSSAG